MIWSNQFLDFVFVFGYNGPLEPCFDLDFDELEDTHTCSNAYAMQKGFNIRINDIWWSKEDKSLIAKWNR